MKPDNMYETSGIPADNKDLESVHKRFVFASLFLAIFALMIAIMAVGIAVYAATRDLESSGSKDTQSGNNEVAPDSIRGSGSACTGVECKNGGSCFNIYPDNYVCVCVATFYGRNCQHGES